MSPVGNPLKAQKAQSQICSGGGGILEGEKNIFERAFQKTNFRKKLGKTHTMRETQRLFLW